MPLLEQGQHHIQYTLPETTLEKLWKNVPEVVRDFSGRVDILLPQGYDLTVRSRHMVKEFFPQKETIICTHGLIMYEHRALTWSTLGQRVLLNIQDFYLEALGK